MFNKMIEQAVSREIDRRSADIPKPISPPQGYNPLEVIRNGRYHWILVPWNDVGVWMKLRTSNAGQLDACGGLSLLNFKDQDGKFDTNRLVEYRNIQEELIKITLAEPSFDEIVAEIEGDDKLIQKIKKEIAELKKIDREGMTNSQKNEIEERIFKAELKVGFLLPENTYGFLTAWAIGADVSDIKKLSKDTLFKAAIRAVQGKTRPSKCVPGAVYTDRDECDIDDAAWSIYYEYKEMKNVEGNSNRRFKWIGGGHK